MSETSKIEILSPPEKVEMADEWFEIAAPDHFWIQWRFKILQKYASLFVTPTNRILEVGCGSGVVIKQFSQLHNKDIDGCDLNLHALKMIGNEGDHIYVYNIFDLNKKMVGQYDSVLLLDVVEHIDNDVEFLQAAAKNLKETGGHVVINVPAFNFLFSRYDTVAGHQRRYTKKTLTALCERAGLEVVKIQYWGLSMIPIAIVRKWILAGVRREAIIQTGFKPPARWVHSVLKFLMKLELSLTDSPAWGTSLLAVVKTRK